MLGIDARRLGLIVAAVLGFRGPVGDEFQFVGGARGRRGEHGADRGDSQRGARQQAIEATHVPSGQAVAAVLFAFAANAAMLRHGRADGNAPDGPHRSPSALSCQCRSSQRDSSDSTAKIRMPVPEISTRAANMRGISSR